MIGGEAAAVAAAVAAVVDERDASANLLVDSRVLDDASGGEVAAAAAAVAVVTPSVDDPLQTIAGRRDRPDRAPEGDSSARRPVAPWRGNLFFALRRRGLAESSGSFANGDPLGMIAGRRDSPDRESEGDFSARRHLSPPPPLLLLLLLLLLLSLLLLLLLLL